MHIINVRNPKKIICLVKVVSNRVFVISVIYLPLLPFWVQTFQQQNYLMRIELLLLLLLPLNVSATAGGLFLSFNDRVLEVICLELPIKSQIWKEYFTLLLILNHIFQNTTHKYSTTSMQVVKQRPLCKPELLYNLETLRNLCKFYSFTHSRYIYGKSLELVFGRFSIWSGYWWRIWE